MLHVTCAIILKQNKFLVAQLDGNSNHPFQWEFPGGKIKTGETAEQCIKREILEELEIHISIIQHLKPVVHDYGFCKIQLIPFLSRIEKGKITIREHARFKWLTFEKFNTIDLVEADKKILVENEKELKKHAREKMNNS